MLLAGSVVSRGGSWDAGVAPPAQENHAESPDDADLDDAYPDEEDVFGFGGNGLNDP